MIGPDSLLFGIIGISIVLIAAIAIRPSLVSTVQGKVIAFMAFFVFPVICAAMGTSSHIERSKKTQFCLSCHIMEPYGRSLYVDDPNYIAAAHFQNHRIPADEACFTCHTDYTMYGDYHAKLRGLHHVWVQYLGKPMNPIHLYKPYNNRECLHCHAGARSFESPTHMAMMDSLKSNEISCVSSGCHDTVHDVASLGNVKFWKPEE